jgi:hypothetical protein
MSIATTQLLVRVKSLELMKTALPVLFHPLSYVLLRWIESVSLVDQAAWLQFTFTTRRSHATLYQTMLKRTCIYF